MKLNKQNQKHLFKVTEEKIKTDIEKYFKIDDISLKTRKYPYPLMRAMYFNLVHKLIYPTSPKLSLAQIGQKCGGFDHSTVLHWIKNFQYELRYEPEITEFYNNYIEDNKKQFTGLVVTNVDLRQPNPLHFN